MRRFALAATRAWVGLRAFEPPLTTTSILSQGALRGFSSEYVIRQPLNEPARPLDTLEENAKFHRFADIYLGGVWNRLESELRKTEGDTFDYDVNFTSGCLRLKLPEDGELIICKDVGDKSLLVESNLHTMTSEGGDPRDEAAFHLNDDGEFADSGKALHEYLEEHLAKHLKVQLDLEPTPGPHEKTYAQDPT